ncbi:MAG: carbamoyltransferase C-terminal domain-containing protein [Gemmatimonadota bacterium]
MGLNILGLNTFHADASACLVREGQVVAAVAEERLGLRRKHFAGFPAAAIQQVLAAGGIGIRDVDIVAVGHDPKANFGAKAAYALRRPTQVLGSALTFLSRERQLDALPDRIARECGFARADCRFELVHVEHHQAHLASSFWGSGFEEAAGFSYDASGDFVSGIYARCGQSIDVIDRVFLPHSLGYFYTAVCQFIGFEEFGEEYKVMGLGAYGDPSFLPVMEKMVTYEGRGQYRLQAKWFTGLLQRSHEELLDAEGRLIIPPLYSKALAEELGPARRRGAEITARERDLAASCQLHFENVVVESLRWLHSAVPSESLVTAGGCALNGVANARILRDTPFRRMYIHGAAGDDGTAVGAALEAWRRSGGRRGTPVQEVYWGPLHDESRMAKALGEAGLSARRLDSDPLISRVADALAGGQVVGWYQGRSEWGPRALGNRSILAHPGWPGMKDIINAKVKRRESFRPFAPSILAERVSDYFEQDVESPFMMHVVRIRPERRAELAAVCHEDNTGRLHTVARAQNPLYYDLIAAFATRTGTPVVLNTSFNENEPIVDTPEQAVACFLRNDIDLLCMGPFVVEKRV